MNNLSKLSELCTKITDGSHYSPVGVNGGYPMFSVKDMRENGFSYDDCKYISSDEFLNMKKSGCVPEVNDILIAKDGSYLKHIFVITENKEEAVLSSIGILRPDVDKVNPYYIKYFLSSNFVKKQVARKYVSGSALPRIILKNFGNIEVPYVGKDTQNKIVKVLKTIDDKIELNNKINSELEAMAKELYEYWFVQFDFPDENGKPYKSSGGKMVWSEELKREIPEGWEVKKAKDICPVVTGKEDANFSTPNGEYKFFTCSQDTLRCDTPAFEGKSILIAGNGVFNVKYYNGMFNAYQRTYVLIPDDEKYVGVLYLVSKDLIDSFTKKSAGSIVKFITKGDVEGITLLDPHNDKLLNQINSIIETIAHNIEENDKLSELRDFLLPMLMNGQVTVR